MPHTIVETDLPDRWYVSVLAVDGKLVADALWHKTGRAKDDGVTIAVYPPSPSDRADHHMLMVRCPPILGLARSILACLLDLVAPFTVREYAYLRSSETFRTFYSDTSDAPDGSARVCRATEQLALDMYSITSMVRDAENQR